MKRLAIAAVLLLAACGPEFSGAGKVVGHDYDDPDDWHEPPYVLKGTTTCNQAGFCTKSPDITISYGGWRHDPAHWYLQVEAEADDKMHTFTVEVSESLWHDCRPGEWFDEGEQWCGVKS